MHAFVHESGSELQATSFTRATINSSTADTNLEKQLIDTNGLVYEGKYKGSSRLNEHFPLRLSHSFPMLTSTKNNDLLNGGKADNLEWDNGNERYFYKYLTSMIPYKHEILYVHSTQIIFQTWTNPLSLHLFTTHNIVSNSQSTMIWISWLLATKKTIRNITQP